MLQLFKTANGDESVVFFTFANTLEEATNMACKEWENHFDEEDQPWDNFETTAMVNRPGVVYWFNTEEY